MVFLRRDKGEFDPTSKKRLNSRGQLKADYWLTYKLCNLKIYKKTNVTFGLPNILAMESKAYFIKDKK